jgi:hypothetical protein
MAFNGNEAVQITLEQGAEYTQRYRAENPGAIKGVFFGRSHIERILAQGDCKGLRLYFAKAEDGVQTLVMVGADSAENDILNVIVEQAQRCPPYCASANSLNSDPSLK